MKTKSIMTVIIPWFYHLPGFLFDLPIRAYLGSDRHAIRHGCTGGSESEGSTRNSDDEVDAGKPDGFIR